MLLANLYNLKNAENSIAIITELLVIRHFCCSAFQASMTGSAARNLNDNSVVTAHKVIGGDLRLETSGESAIGHDLEQHLSA